MTENKKKHYCDKSECPVSHAMDIVGDAWSILIIRDMLMMGKHEYKEIMESPEKISTNILSDRLKKLHCYGIIKWVYHPESKTRKLYYLTDSGKDFIHIIMALATWANKHVGSVDLPTGIKDALEGNPEGIVEECLKSLEEWEAQYL
jgi:DNA-binding HxlR family transcriptional regulator